jgi:hypothetical protein
LCLDFDPKMGWVTFSQTHLVTLPGELARKQFHHLLTSGNGAWGRCYASIFGEFGHFWAKNIWQEYFLLLLLLLIWTAECPTLPQVPRNGKAA